MPRARPLLLLVFLLATHLNAFTSSAGGVASGAPAAGTAPTGPPSPAASLTESFGEIGKNFEAANPGTKVTFSFGCSNDLAAQISKGAPADVFASANTSQINVVVKSGQVAADAPKTFARNRLVVIYLVANPGKITSLADLARPGLEVVLEDKSVPVGQYSLDFLAKASRDPT